MIYRNCQRSSRMRQSRVRSTLLLLLPQHEDVRQELAIRSERMRGVQESKRRLPTTFCTHHQNAQHISYKLHHMQQAVWPEKPGAARGRLPVVGLLKWTLRRQSRWWLTVAATARSGWVCGPGHCAKHRNTRQHKPSQIHDHGWRVCQLFKKVPQSH